MPMKTENMREALKQLNNSPKWISKVNKLTPQDVADYYKRLKKQNQF